MKALTDEEFAEIVEKYQPRVWRWAGDILASAGYPPGIVAKDEGASEECEPAIERS